SIDISKIRQLGAFQFNEKCMPEQNNKRIWYIRMIDKNGLNLSNARHKISGQFKAGGGDEYRCKNKKKN
ncbi:MAG: hypothetical protein R3C26_26880, partial [Calditrichia bacterium]